MSSDDEDLSVTRNATWCFPFALIILVGGGLALEITGLVKMSTKYDNQTSQLCRIVPSSDQCTSFNNASRQPNKTTDYQSDGEIVFSFFVYTQANCIFFQFLALMMIFCRIGCCLHIINWICGCDRWGSIVVVCAGCCQCRFGWIVVELAAGVLCIASCVILGCFLPTRDIVQIDGFKFCVIFGVTNIFKVALSIVYHKKIGCPPGDILLGTNLRYSDVRIRHSVSPGTEIETSTWEEDDWGRKINLATQTRYKKGREREHIEIKKRY